MSKRLELKTELLTLIQGLDELLEHTTSELIQKCVGEVLKDSLKSLDFIEDVIILDREEENKYLYSYSDDYKNLIKRGFNYIIKYDDGDIVRYYQATEKSSFKKQTVYLPDKFKSSIEYFLRKSFKENFNCEISEMSSKLEKVFTKLPDKIGFSLPIDGYYSKGFVISLAVNVKVPPKRII